jgi:tryptophan synthase alpha chain
MSRIPATFEALQARRRKALIPFITAGDPSIELTVPLMHALVEAGADIIELGMPFSDPMADGPAIQRSSERALRNHTNLKAVLGAVEQFRSKDSRTPVVLIGYANRSRRWVPSAPPRLPRAPAWMGCWSWTIHRRRAASCMSN